MIKCFLASLMVFFSSFLLAQINPMYVGSYTSNGSDGIYIYNFDDASGMAVLDKSIKTSNPSFLARKGDILYFVNENTEGSISAYNLTENRFLNSLPTNGAHPCHVSLSPNMPLAVVSNYSGGSLVLYSLNEDGSLQKQEDILKFTNSSINNNRQEKSHVHSAFFSNDGKFLYVSDLGGDLIYKMSIEKNQGGYKFNIIEEIKTKAGGGPRHIVISDDGQRLYVVLELTGEVEVLTNAANKWVSKQVLPIYGNGFLGEHGAADIKMSADGKNIYATNRGTSNEVVTYKVGKDGLLKIIQVESVGGISPRNLQISPDGKWIIFANQSSGFLTIFKRDPKSGKLKNTNQTITVPSAVCTIF